MPTLGALPVLPSASGTDVVPVLSGGVVYQGTRDQLTNSLEINLQGQIDSNDVDIINLQNGKLDLAGTGAAPMTGLLELSGAPTSNLHASTKLYTDGADNLRLDLAGTGTMTGSLDMGTNSITNVVNPTSAQDAATQDYVITTTAKTLEAYDPTTTSAFPVLYGSATITTGDRFNVTAAGTADSGGVTLQIGDVLEARVDSATDNTADWSVTNGNTFTASTTVSGISELATDAETLALSSSTRVITPSNLAALNATTTQEGLISTATDAETITATSTTLGITASNLAAQVTDYEVFIGIPNILSIDVGAWTTTRVAQGDYVHRKTAANTTSVIGIDITEAYRTTANFGFELNGFSVINRNTGEALDAHSVTLDRLSYTDSGVVSTTSVTITGTLPVAIDADPTVTLMTVTTPVFLNDGKYVIELNVDGAASSVYDFIGILLHFHRTVI